MLRAWIVGVVSLGLAALACNDALGRAAGRQANFLAERLPFASGFVRTHAANLILARGLEPGTLASLKLDDASKRKAEGLSRAGYRREPLNYEALRNLALLAQAKGHANEARGLMRAAGRLTRRDLAVNAWLASDYARLGQVDAALAMYDQALRSSAQAQDLVLPTIIGNLKNDALVDPVVTLLARRPPWQNAFWSVAPRYSAALSNLARVRLALADRRIPVEVQSDRELVAAVAGGGYFAQADAIARSLTHDRRGSGEVLANSGFDRRTEFLPFDWQAMFDASLTADLDPRAGTLRIAAIDEGSGPAARQAVALPGQSYALTVRALDWTAASANRVYFKLRCAERGTTAETRPIYLDRPNFSATVTKPLPTCVYHWLTIFAAPLEHQAESVVVLDRVSLSPAQR